VSLLVASTVAAISNWSPEGSWWLEFFQVPGWPHELVGGFLAILLVFRTDQAYGRFWEGRTLWAQMAAELRSLTRVTVSNRDLLSPQAVDEVLAHLAAYPVALKQHLRGENNPDELQVRVLSAQHEPSFHQDKPPKPSYNRARSYPGAAFSLFPP
jgi:predicted membrane chloride channel (bestrophin family)